MSKTTSLWGPPPQRYYSFLRRVEQVIQTRPLRMAILGCSDGKFVLPAARRGYEVLAIDVDSVALYGGDKTDATGKVYMPGLVARLERECLSKQVIVVAADFVEYPHNDTYHAVFTSGAIQYSRNMKHGIEDIVASLKTYVMRKGFLYVDYMLPLEEKYAGRENYPNREQWSEFFRGDEWCILYNRVLPPVFEGAHVDNPIDHYHHWGHLLVKREGDSS